MGKDWNDILMNGEMTQDEILSHFDAGWTESGPAGDWTNDVPPHDEMNGTSQPPPGTADGTADTIGLGEWDAGEDDAEIRPRGWLLGNQFCRRCASSLIADGGVGKTALRIAQALSLASDKALTGDHVFQRCRVLIISLEDDPDELRRRVRAAMLHHVISHEEINGWLFLAAPGGTCGKLAIEDGNGTLSRAVLADTIEAIVVKRQIDFVILDPFVKSHAVPENSNNAIDGVMQILTDMASKHDIAVDVPHHTNKGPAEAGNPDRGRGASAMKDAARLVYTLTPMTKEEAQTFGVTEAEQRRLIRLDSGKVNIAPPQHEARWFRLVGVNLDNGTDLYPNGDEVQTVEVWVPPDAWEGVSNNLLNRILDDIDAGLDDGRRYSGAPAAKERAAWEVVLKHAPDKREADARQIIKTWVKNGVLHEEEYDDPKDRKTVKGLKVVNAKRPS